MNNNTDDIISNENDVPSFTFKEWPLDEDDEEFRAGYPFSPVPSEELNEQETWHDPSATSDNHDFQLDHSSNNGFNKTTKEEDEASRFSIDGQKECMKFDIKSSEIHNDKNGHNVNPNQKQDHQQHERNKCDQDNIVQTDNVNDKQTNQAHPAK